MKRYVIELQSELEAEELRKLLAERLPGARLRAEEAALNIPDYIASLPDDNPNKAMMVELSQLPVMTDEEYEFWRQKSEAFNRWS